MSSYNTDRNLLAGMLALQMDLISQQNLISAMQSWMLEKSKPIESHLLEQGAISTEEHGFIEAIIKKYSEKSDEGFTKAISELSSRSSLELSLSLLGEPSIDRTLQSVKDKRKEKAPYEETVIYSPQQENQAANSRRFRVIRPHAKGGLGQVSVAADLELHREVALKEMQAPYWTDPLSKQRFLLEAEITGRLEHPGIVPVYSLGTTEQGRPFYVMRFIQGNSLKEELAEFHRNSASRHAEEYRIGVRKLLRRFVDVCNAMEYAHSRGVLHRDLKPSNIMLGKYGETLVVDWGLAKTVSKSEKHQNTDEPTVVPQSSEGSSETRFGFAVGTLAYMSPEQAKGRHDLLSSASDVYCLGGTLYSILTGKTPIAPGTQEEMLDAIQHGRIRYPRSICQEVPAALEAICMKSLRTDPRQRYESAAALAEDIENWLADEPVTAFLEPFVLRMQRWVRKHRVLSSGIAVATVALCISLSVIASMVSRQNRQLRVARDAESEARVLAELAKSQAVASEQEAIRQKNRLLQLTDTTMQIAEEYLGEVSGADNYRDQLLSDSLATYREMLAESPSNEEYLAATMKAARLSGMQKARVRDSKTGIERLRESISLQEQIAAAERSDDRSDYLGETYRDLGTVLKQEGRFIESLAALETASGIHRALQTKNPNNLKYLRSLAMVELSAAGAYIEQHAFDKATESAQIAAKAFQRLSEEPEMHKMDPVMAVASLNTAGRSLARQGAPEKALQHYADAIPLCEALLKKIPESVDTKVAMARLLGAAGEGLTAAGSKDPRVVTWCDQSIEIWNKLLSQKVVNLSHVSQRGEVYRARALQHAFASEFDQAEAMFAKAIEAGAFATEKAQSYEFKYQYGLTLTQLALFYDQRDEKEKSVTTIASAREWLEKALAQSAEAVPVRVALEKAKEIAIAFDSK